MSGYTHGRRRCGVEGCVRVDVAMLRRAGLLSSETVTARPSWVFSYDKRGEPVCHVIGYSKPAGVELCIMRAGAREPSSRQLVRVTWTRPNYGGARAWVHCPLCGRRVFRLFGYLHLVNERGERTDCLLCRHCLPVTYEVRNVSDWELARLRAGRIVKRLGGSDWERLPSKPKYMRWPTYWRLAERWGELARQANTASMAKFARLLGIA